MKKNTTTPPLVEGGQAMVDNSLIVAGCAFLAIVVAAVTASVVTAGFGVGLLVVAAGAALYFMGKSDGRATRKQQADRVCDELRRRWEGE